MRDGVRVDPVSLASGAAIAALGALVLLDSAGAIDVSLGWMAVVLAVFGAALLGGLARGGGTAGEAEPAAWAGWEPAAPTTAESEGASAEAPPPPAWPTSTAACSACCW